MKHQNCQVWAFEFEANLQRTREDEIQIQIPTLVFGIGSGLGGEMYIMQIAGITGATLRGSLFIA